MSMNAREAHSAAANKASNKTSTKTALLDVAEQLFSDKGFAETSLRHITASAGVNLASVNYHFGSKKALIQAVFARFLTPFCHTLETELTEYGRDSARDTRDLKPLLKILTDTVLGTTAELHKEPRIFMRLLGLAYTQGQGHLRRFLKSEYGEVFERFTQHIIAATPHLSARQRFWRIHFALGAIIFALSGAESLTAMAEYDLGETSSMEEMVDRMVLFLDAGLNHDG